MHLLGKPSISLKYSKIVLMDLVSQELRINLNTVSTFSNNFKYSIGNYDIYNNANIRNTYTHRPL